jgi:transposase InsO family protein
MSDYLSRSPVGAASDTNEDIIDSITPTIAAVTTRSRARQETTKNITTVNPSSSSTNAPNSLSPPNSDNFRIDFTGDLDVLRSAQLADANLKYIIDHIAEPRFQHHYSLDNGLLMFLNAHSKPVPCVPVGKIRRDIITIYHDTPGNGAHFGRDKTIRKIRDRYYWHSMNADITNHIRSCLRCIENNPIRRRPPGHLQPIPPPEGTWQLLALDFHGPIQPTSRRGNHYIISLTDLFSKYVITRAVRDCTASTAARFLQEDVICKFGTPKCLLTDNGTHFTASMIEQLLKRFGILHLYSTPYHPQSNGQIERFNSTMDAKIAALSNQSRSDWDDQLSFVTFNYNTSVHSTTQIIPFELMFGRPPVLPCDPQQPMVSFPSHSAYLTESRQHLVSLTTRARNQATVAQNSSKSRYDQHRSKPSYNINDLVLLRNIHRRRQLDVRYEGPYRILHRLRDKTYVVEHIHLPRCIRQVTVDSMIPLLDRHLK